MLSNRALNTVNTWNLEWLCIKIPFTLFWFNTSLYLVQGVHSISIEKGACLLFNCDQLTNDFVKYVLISLLAVFSVLCILERSMVVTTFALFAISFLICSAHESYGVSDRSGIVTLIWFSQFLAYSMYQNDKAKLVKNRIFFPVQVIAACYTLSAISKIATSGISWFQDGHLMVLQMLKSNQMEYLDGTLAESEIMSPKIQFVMEHTTLMGTFLLIALLTELTSGLGLINKKMRFIYGILLLLLHLGINFFFGIIIVSFFTPMIIFMINPFYLIINKILIFRPKTA